MLVLVGTGGVASAAPQVVPLTLATIGWIRVDAPVALHVSEEGKGHGFAGEVKSAFERGNRLRMAILEPLRPAENEVPM